MLSVACEERAVSAATPTAGPQGRYCLAQGSLGPLSVRLLRGSFKGTHSAPSLQDAPDSSPGMAPGPRTRRSSNNARLEAEWPACPSRTGSPSPSSFPRASLVPTQCSAKDSVFGLCAQWEDSQSRWSEPSCLSIPHVSAPQGPGSRPGSERGSVLTPQGFRSGGKTDGGTMTGRDTVLGQNRAGKRHLV